jgi:hypothetical protein
VVSDYGIATSDDGIRTRRSGTGVGAYIWLVLFNRNAGKTTFLLKSTVGIVPLLLKTTKPPLNEMALL